MRKIREVLRLRLACGLSKRAVAATMGISATAVGDYVARARRAGLTWPLPAELGDEELERRREERPPPDWAAIHLDLRRADVMLGRVDIRTRSIISESACLWGATE
jgi:hypothetical protein